MANLKWSPPCLENLKRSPQLQFPLPETWINCLEPKNHSVSSTQWANVHLGVKKKLTNRIIEKNYDHLFPQPWSWELHREVPAFQAGTSKVLQLQLQLHCQIVSATLQHDDSLMLQECDSRVNVTGTTVSQRRLCLPVVSNVPL